MSPSTILFADVLKEDATLTAVVLAVAFVLFLVVVFVVVRRVTTRALLKSHKPKK